MKLNQLPALLKATFQEWSEDNCLRLGASLAYYTLSSLVPLLLIVVAIATFVLNFTGAGQDYKSQLVNEITQRVNNPSLAQQITSALTAKSEDAASKGTLSSILGVVFLLLAASGVFGELDAAFNIIWNVPSSAQGKGMWGFIRTKFLSFTLVLGVAFLLLVSQLLTLVLTALAGRLPLGVLWTIVNFAVSVAVTTAVFALLFKFLPDTHVEWGDVWIGGLISAILWIVGQQLLAIYFKVGTSFSSYGALGGILAFLVYVYYSSQILFIGGEFTQVYANTQGSRKPVPQAQTAGPGISKEAAIMVTTAATVGQQRHQEEVAALKTRQYAAAATGGIVGLVGGALIGGVGLIVGLTRGVGKLRGR
jgi:membrane protein